MRRSSRQTPTKPKKTKPKPMDDITPLESPKPKIEHKVKKERDSSDPVLKTTRQQMVERYLQLVEEYKYELQEKERIEQETKAVMRQIASIPKQNQYIDQLFLQLEEEKALNTQQHNNQQLQQDTKTEETNNLQN